MRSLWRRHPWITSGFVAALGVALVLGGRGVWQATHWDDGAAPPVEGWMTPRYIVRTYGVDPADLSRTLGIEAGSAPRQTLEEIAKDRGQSPESLIAQVAAEVAAADGE